MHRSHTRLPVLGASLFFLFALSAARAQAQLNCQICTAQCVLSGCSLPTCGSASVGGCDCEVKTRFLRDRAIVTCLTSGACNSLDGSLCPGEDDRPPRVEVTVEDGEANVRVEVETPNGTVVAEGTLRERGASGRIVIERADASGSLEHIDW